MQDSLDVIDPTALRRRIVKFRGEDLEVVPLTIGQLPRFAAALEPAIGELGKLQRDVDVAAVCTFIGTHGDAITEAVAIATRRSLDWIRDGLADEFIELAVAVVAVNGDFFARRLVPKLTEGLGGISAAIAAQNGTGRTP